MAELTTRCTRCRAEFTADELDDATACPKCGTTNLPQAIAEDVTVAINWHELRILVIGAERWAAMQCHRDGGQGMAVVYEIADRLVAQHLEMKNGLTLRSDLAAVELEFGPLETNFPDPPE